MKKIAKNANLFIDSSSNSSENKATNCLMLMPYLEKNTTYVIENVIDTKIANKLESYHLEFKRKSKMSSRDDRLLLVKHK